jgi:predicted phosphodiesterase
VRIRVLSDLHFEFHRDGGKEFVSRLDPKGVDLLILAGDITRVDVGIHKSLALFRQRFTCPIVFIPGNHEYHKTNRQTAERAIKNAVSQLKGVHWLDCGIFELGGKRILGTTLWYGRHRPPEGIVSTEEEWARGTIRMLEPTKKVLVEHTWTDFENIENLDTWVYDENGRAVRFLCDNMREGDIVVTHILPCRQSVPAKYGRSVSNAFFLSDITPLIEDRKPALVIHGHTHMSNDYMIGPTRVVCNPFGYMTSGEVNDDFDENLNIDVV